MMDLNRVTELCVDLSITPNQLYFMQCLEDSIKGFAALTKYLNESPQLDSRGTSRLMRWETEDEKHLPNVSPNTEHKKKQFTHEEIDDLVQRRYVYKRGVTRDTSYGNYELSEYILNKLRMVQSHMADEFWNLYPRTKIKNGQVFEIKSEDPDSLKQHYLRAINASPNKHKEVMDKLKNMIETGNNPALGIARFVAARYWENYEIQQVTSDRL